MKTLLLTIVAFATVFSGGAAQLVHYTLVNDSTYLNECLICGRPSLFEPLRGSFDLVLIRETPTNRSCVITNIAFVTRSDPPTTITGYGTLLMTFGTSSNQQVTLFAHLNGEDKLFTNDISDVTWQWPMINVHVVQTQVNLVSFDSMNIVAAPVRDLWFATAQDFFSTNLNRTVTAGDLLSTSGRVVKARSELLASVGITTSATLDSITVAPGAEVLFSLRNDTAATNGLLHHGDALSNRRRVAYSNATLTAGFAPQPAGTDLGLDALYVGDNGQVYFSTTTDFISPAIGILSHGDVLGYNPNGDGLPNRLVKTRQQLLAPFQPVNASFDPGLDSLFVWPDGEIWFSTEQNFDTQTYGTISHGDLLSDSGRIIFRNDELTGSFAAPPTNSGLTAVFVVSDISSPSAQFNPPHVLWPGGNVSLAWTGSLRVAQLERGALVTGPYLPMFPISAETNWLDVSRAGTNSQSFYRLRIW